MQFVKINLKSFWFNWINNNKNNKNGIQQTFSLLVGTSRECFAIILVDSYIKSIAATSRIAKKWISSFILVLTITQEV